MNYFNARDYEENSEGYLGEFVYTNGSGWMYSVNHVFPNVSFADTYLSDGDVVRVQFTLAYGADIGGASAMGGSLPGGGQTPSAYYDVADKDALTAQIAAARASGRMGEAAVSAAYKEAVRTAATLNIGQGRWIRPQPSLPPLCRAAMGRQRTPPPQPQRDVRGQRAAAYRHLPPLTAVPPEWRGIVCRLAPARS